MEEEPDPFYHEEAEEENDTEANNNGTEQKDDEAEEAPTRKSTTVKRIVRNPQPKLNPDRLRGPKGIPELLRMSKNMKLKGKGHELQDLNLIMNTLKHWGHRLFPKIMSDDFFERVERLGTKKTVQGYVRRVRIGLETVDVSAVPKSFDTVASDDEDDVQRGVDDHRDVVPHEDLFESLLDRTTDDSENLPPSSHPSQTSRLTMPLDEDAKARAERNRQMAIERRLKRLAEKSHPSTANDTVDQPVSSATDSSTLQDSCQGLQEPSNSCLRDSETNFQHDSRNQESDTHDNPTILGGDPNTSPPEALMGVGAAEHERTDTMEDSNAQEAVEPDENWVVSAPKNSESSLPAPCSPGGTTSPTSVAHVHMDVSSKSGTLIGAEPTDESNYFNKSGVAEASGLAQQNAGSNDSEAVTDPDCGKFYDASEPLFESADPMEVAHMIGT